MLFLYLAVLGTAMYYVVKLLGPEMAKPVPVKIVSESTPTSTPTSAPVTTSTSKSTSEIVAKTTGSDNRVEKLEILLAEKNKNILLLQKELKIFHAQISNFDKIKSVLEEEIQRLREQNRIFRSELGLPAVQAQENSMT